MNRRSTVRRSFTLLEVLVATMITGIAVVTLLSVNAKGARQRITIEPISGTPQISSVIRDE